MSLIAIRLKLLKGKSLHQLLYTACKSCFMLFSTQLQFFQSWEQSAVQWR